MNRLYVIIPLCIFTFAACAPKQTATLKAPETKPAPKSLPAPRREPARPAREPFIQEGMAGWYGKDFYGSTVTGGEKFDVQALTAAHKTLSIGTWVKVRNMDNGSEAVVKVSRRGPLVKGRILDLSYAAAKKLGLEDTGSARVRLEALGYRSAGEESYREPESYTTGVYTVQIAANADQLAAKRLADEMKKLFGFGDVQPAVINNEQVSVVRAGKYLSLREAEEAERKFIEHGYPRSFVISLE